MCETEAKVHLCSGFQAKNGAKDTGTISRARVIQAQYCVLCSDQGLSSVLKLFQSDADNALPLPFNFLSIEEVNL